jgi:hypothetical protein
MYEFTNICENYLEYMRDILKMYKASVKPDFVQQIMPCLI